MSKTSTPIQNKESKNNQLNQKTDLAHFIKQHQQSTQKNKIPPLHLWNPEYCGKMDLVIKANGEWWHEGTKMTRQSLVDLFATVLWKEENDGKTSYFLKTPVEKIEITVEDAPLFINQVDLITDGQLIWIELTTTTKDTVRLDDKHPFYFKTTNGEQKPYIMVRNGLEGLISRSVFYHLIEIGELSEHEGKTVLTLQSGDKEFTLTVFDDESY